MSLQALDQPERVPTAQVDAKPRPERRLSRRMRQALDLLASGKAATQKAAAEAVGMAPETLSRALQKSSAQVFIAQRARQTIAIAAGRASERVAELMDAASEHVSLAAATHVLGIANIRPPESGSHVSVNVGVSVGYVIDLTPQSAHTPQAPNTVQVIDNVESEA